MNEEDGWLEATIAWAVCASIHREYAKGKDPFFKTRQADFVKAEKLARSKIKSEQYPPPLHGTPCKAPTT